MNDLFNSNNELLANPNNGIVSQKTVLENYVEGNVCFHIHVTVKSGGLPPGDYCAVFQYPERSKPFKAADEGDVLHNLNSKILSSSPTQMESAVLVHVGDFLKNPEYGLRPFLPCVERLYLLDDGPCLCANATDLMEATSSPISQKEILVEKDGELRESDRTSDLLNRSVINGVIEGGTKIVSDITNSGRPIVRDGFTSGKDQGLLAYVVIQFIGDGITLTPTKAGDFSLKMLQVLSSPSHLGVCPSGYLHLLQNAEVEARPPNTPNQTGGL